MTYNLFIDDERFPHDVTWMSWQDTISYRTEDWEIARNMTEVREIIEKMGFPACISFDHDLGEKEPTGYDIAKWLVKENSLSTKNYEITKKFCFMVHSKNPIGAKNIESYINNYLRFKFE